ncbi:MAG: TonB family protein [Bacteroidota bacterium]
MKKPVLILCLFLLTCQCFAQATKSVVKDSLNYREKYDVLKADPQIKQGKYRLSVKSSGKILTTGFYKNNRRDSVWREYNPRDYVIAEGHYKNGQKYGEWTYYGNLWKVSNKYDFTKNQLTFHQPTRDDSTHAYRVITGHDTMAVIMDRAPIYLGGEMMYRSLLYNIRYPELARSKHVAGRVIISFTIDEQGHVRDYHIDKSLGYGCDEEALRVVKLIPDDWVPGKLLGKYVAVSMRLPVMFNLD